MLIDARQAPSRRAALPGWVNAARRRGDRRFRLCRRGARHAPTAVKVRKRFLGWPNFVFDTALALLRQVGRRSGRSLIVSGERTQAGHVERCTCLRQHLEQRRSGSMATSGRSCCRPSSWPLSARCSPRIVAFPLAFFAARNITPNGLANQVTQALLRLPALGRHADLGAVLHPRLRPRAAGRHLGDLLHRHRHARQDLFGGAGEHRRQAARGRALGGRHRRCWCSAMA